MSLKNLKEEYDVAVIGAGVGGLTAAALLSRAGLRVVVFEMSNQCGGYLAGFERKNFRFDTAIHWLNQCNPGGLVHTVFECIGTDYPKAKPQNRIKRFIGDEHSYLLTANPDVLKNQLQKDFPEDAKGIERFFKDAKELGEKMFRWGTNVRSMETMSLFEKATNGMMMLRFVLPFIKHIRYEGEEGLQKGLKKYFTNTSILKLFSSEPDLLSCLIPIGWAYFGDFQNPPAGGGQSFPAWLSHVVNELDGQIYLHTQVKKILLENDTAVGVEIDHRNEVRNVRSKYVLAACDVETLYEKMLPSEIIPQKLKENLKKAVLYNSSLTISIALDCTAASLGFNEEMFHITRQDVPRKELSSANPETTEILVLAPSERDSTLAPASQGTLTIFIPALMEHYDFWETEKADDGHYERGDNYKNLKTVLAEKLIKRVAEKVSPNLEKHVLFYHVATPITHFRYTGNKNGTMMGARPGKENMQSKIAHYQTSVKNLYLSGHWAELGGGVPIAAKAGFNASLLVLKNEKPDVFKLLTNYVGGKKSGKDVRESSLMKPYANDWQREPTTAEKWNERRKV